LLRQGLNDADFFVLSLLGLRQPLSVEEIAAHLSFTGIDFGEPSLTRLREKGFLVEDTQAARLYRLSPQGEAVIMRVMAACKTVESDLVACIGAHEARSLRHLLKRVIHASDPGLPKVWVRR
jgi:3-hydroxy-9,10-secoandrosta-1,3,5(10)-triene-9,17-dione monooxygenase reductase component